MKTTIIDGDDYRRVREHASRAEIGGRSHVRKSDRQSELSTDQLVGQLGEFALCRYLGDEEFYFTRRQQIDLNPTKGDDGFDWKTAVDVKTSLMRRSQDPSRYRLAVRPRERHEGNLYILALLATIESPVKVWLVGWAHDSDLLHPEVGGVFEGAYTIMAPNLRDMNSLPVPRSVPKTEKPPMIPADSLATTVG